MISTEQKLERLKNNLAEMGKVIVAFSGGADSTFLLKVAHDVLGGDAAAVTARSSTYPEREFAEASEFVKSLGLRHIVIDSDELDTEDFADNPADRCYYCKKALYGKIARIASENGIRHILDGSNKDDLGDFRPGMKAAEEYGISSPLQDADLAKDEIRKLSRGMGLSTWNKPAFACLASRIPYGQRITREKLEMIGKAEQFLLDLGFRQVRVRHHGDVARIEVPYEERTAFFEGDVSKRVSARFREIGFQYAALDLMGYRTGSMNEVLDVKHNEVKHDEILDMKPALEDRS